MIVQRDGIYNTVNTSIAIKFSPDFAANDGINRYLFDADYVGGKRYNLLKASDNDIDIVLGLTAVANIAYATYVPYWKVGRENIIVITGTTGNNKIWLNGVRMTNTLGDAVAWTAKNPDKITIGAYDSIPTAFSFDGKIHYFKVWNRLLTDTEVANLSADRETFVQAPSRTGLVGWWTMDANDINGTKIYDKSGQNNNGTSVNTPTVAVGKINQSMVFNGSSDVVTSAIDADSNAALTVSYWSYVTAADLNDREIDQQDSGPANGFSFTHPVDLSPQIAFAIRNSTTNVAQIQSTGRSFNKWDHIVGVYAENNVCLYVNGILNGVCDTSATMTNSAATLNIGKRAGASSNYFTGNIDDVRIYNRALSAQEVSNLYSAKQNFIR